MRKYQRGVIVAFAGLLATTFVKVRGTDSPKQKAGGWVHLNAGDIDRVRPK